MVLLLSRTQGTKEINDYLNITLSLKKLQRELNKLKELQLIAPSGSINNLIWNIKI
ncbi:MAG: hypothetical protein JWM09_1313 [Francisellaceae bacterium]|nr:hypothetical protein [Francisellaceae bacterium]